MDTRISVIAGTLAGLRVTGEGEEGVTGAGRNLDYAPRND